MKCFSLVAILSLSIAPAYAQSSFNGTWKADIASVQLPTRPTVFELKDGVFSCSTCIPAFSIPADGRFHAVSDDPYVDQTAVSLADKGTVTIIDMKDGRVTSNATLTVSADGGTLATIWVDTSAPAVPGTTAELIRTRTGAGASGEHAISGSWQASRYVRISDAALLSTIALDGKTVKMSSPAGISYTAPLGGAPVPIEGDISGATVSLRQISASVIEETEYRKGKPAFIRTYSVAPDGKTMTVTADNKLNNSSLRYAAYRQ